MRDRAKRQQFAKAAQARARDRASNVLRDTVVSRRNLASFKRRMMSIYPIVTGETSRRRDSPQTAPRAALRQFTVTKMNRTNSMHACNLEQHFERKHEALEESEQQTVPNRKILLADRFSAFYCHLTCDLCRVFAVRVWETVELKQDICSNGG